MTTIRMRALFDAPEAALDAPDEDGHMRLINQYAPTPLSREDVHIRSMHLCSSQLCESDWLRFSHAALERIVEMIPGQSVLAGHDRRSLPVARFFKAQIVERADVPDPVTGRPTEWIRAWFYWLKATQGANDLALNMDGGIYREVSISWMHRGGRCSVCDGASGFCPHLPGEIYDGQRCFIWIDEVVDVLEGSLVYRGADRETGISGEHLETVEGDPCALERLLRFDTDFLYGESEAVE